MALFDNTLWDSSVWEDAIWAAGVWDDAGEPALVLLSDGELGPDVAFARSTPGTYWGEL